MQIWNHTPNLVLKLLPTPCNEIAILYVSPRWMKVVNFHQSFNERHCDTDETTEFVSSHCGHSAFPNVTRVTAVLAHSLGELLLLGTEGGHVFIVEVPGFRELEERNISLDQVANRFVTHDTRLHAKASVLWPHRRGTILFYYFLNSCFILGLLDPLYYPLH